METSVFFNHPEYLEELFTGKNSRSGFPVSLLGCPAGSDRKDRDRKLGL